MKTAIDCDSATPTTGEAEEIDDETGLDDPEYYLPPLWIRGFVDEEDSSEA